MVSIYVIDLSCVGGYIWGMANTTKIKHGPVGCVKGVFTGGLDDHPFFTTLGLRYHFATLGCIEDVMHFVLDFGDGGTYEFPGFATELEGDRMTVRVVGEICHMVA